MVKTISVPSNIDTRLANSSIGQFQVRIRDVDITSYTSGGEPLTPAELGLSNIFFISIMAKEKNYYAWYDYANEKVIVINPWTFEDIQIPNGTDCGVMRIFALGY